MKDLSAKWINSFRRGNSIPSSTNKNYLADKTNITESIVTNIKGEYLIDSLSLIDLATKSDVHNKSQIDSLSIKEATIGLLVPAPPTNFTAVGGNSQITLTWTASPEATSYNVYRSIVSGGETLYGVNVLSGSIDTGLTNGITYYYQITSVGPGGESVLSSEISCRPGHYSLDFSKSISSDYLSFPI